MAGSFGIEKCNGNSECIAQFQDVKSKLNGACSSENVGNSEGLKKCEDNYVNSSHRLDDFILKYVAQETYNPVYALASGQAKTWADAKKYSRIEFSIQDTAPAGIYVEISAKEKSVPEGTKPAFEYRMSDYHPDFLRPSEARLSRPCALVLVERKLDDGRTTQSVFLSYDPILGRKSNWSIIHKEGASLLGLPVSNDVVRMCLYLNPSESVTFDCRGKGAVELKPVLALPGFDEAYRKCLREIGQKETCDTYKEVAAAPEYVWSRSTELFDVPATLKRSDTWCE